MSQASFAVAAAIKRVEVLWSVTILLIDFSKETILFLIYFLANKGNCV